MTKALTFLDEKKIYVSWGILCVVVAATAMLTKIMISQDQFIEQIRKMDGRISKIESDLYFNNPTKQ